MNAVGWWSLVMLFASVTIATGLVREWHARGWREVWQEEKNDAAGFAFGMMFALAVWWIFFGYATPVVMP